MQVLEFGLEIGQGTGREYPVTVLSSPSGQAQELMLFPFSVRALAGRLDDLEETFASFGRQPSTELAEQEHVLRDLGQRLFDALLVGKLRSLYDLALNQAARQNKLFRLDLYVRAPDLVKAPWEFLYDSRSEEFVCLAQTVSIVRHLNPPEAVDTVNLPPPLRVLGIIAGAPESAQPDIDRVKTRLEEAGRGLRTRGLLELEWLQDPTWRDLLRAISAGPWHVLYLASTGALDEATGDAYMILAGAEGHRQHLGAARLARVLASKKSSSLVWLGPCPGAERGPGERFSVAASTLVQRGLPAVLTTPYLMSDKASVAFARVLFTALAGALPVELAVAQARSAVYQQAIRPGEWGIPVLYAHKPSWQLVDRAALAATASVRGDAALAQDDFAEAIDGYRLASEIDAHPVDLERKELAEEIRRILGDANHTLSTLTGSAESQAVAVMKAMEDLEKAQQSLPESRTIELVLSRARQEALALRDRLWSEGQQLMKSHAVGQTLDRRHRRAERCVRLFEKAVKLDSESLPALSEDLTRAVNRLGYLRQAQASIRAQRGRRRLLYGIVSVAVIAGLLWLSVAFGLVPAAMFKVKVPKVALLPPRPTAAYTLVPASATATVPLPTATFTVVATPVPEQVSATATLSPVWSSTPSPSPTHAARPSPSRTAMPSAFASPTLGLTPAHTQTPALIYPSETPTATPRRATPTPVPTPTRGIVYAAPTLLQPEDVIYLSQDSSGLLTMRWTWAGTLQPDEWFDIRVWREGTPHYGIAWTKQSEYTYDICLKGSGQVYWSIAIVHGQNGQWLSDLSPEAAPRRFWSSRSDEWCSSRGRPVQSLPPATGAP